MNTKNWILLGVAVVLGACYAIFNTEWLRPDPIQIQAQVREISGRASLESRRVPREEREGRKAQAQDRKQRGGKAPAPSETGKFDGVYPVVFALDGEYRLTSVRVIEDQPSVPGHAPLIVWQLNSTSNSAPTKALLYGKTPRGMKLKDERNKPARLLPGTVYRLEVQAGRYQGKTTFQTKEIVPPDAPAGGS